MDGMGGGWRGGGGAGICEILVQVVVAILILEAAGLVDHSVVAVAWIRHHNPFTNHLKRCHCAFQVVFLRLFVPRLPRAETHSCDWLYWQIIDQEGVSR